MRVNTNLYVSRIEKEMPKTKICKYTLTWPLDKTLEEIQDASQ